jgi:hypothetical protein
VGRFGRFIFNVLAAASLPVCGAFFVNVRGRTYLSVPAPADSAPVSISPVTSVSIEKNRLGFGAVRVHSGNRSMLSEVFIPNWFCGSVAGALPVIWAVNFRSRWRRESARLERLRREQRGEVACASCGYDLRATPEQCPECGAVPSGVKG